MRSGFVCLCAGVKDWHTGCSVVRLHVVPGQTNMMIVLQVYSSFNGNRSGTMRLKEWEGGGGVCIILCSGEAMFIYLLLLLLHPYSFFPAFLSLRPIPIIVLDPNGERTTVNQGQWRCDTRFQHAKHVQRAIPRPLTQ